MTLQEWKEELENQLDRLQEYAQASGDNPEWARGVLYAVEAIRQGFAPSPVDEEEHP